MTKPTKTKIVIGIIILAAAASAGWLWYSQQPADSSSAPVFTFDQSKAKDWYASPNYNNRANADPGAVNKTPGATPIEQLPVAGIGVHHNGPNNTDQHADNCFVLYSYYDWSIDSAKTYAEYEASIDKWGSFELVDSHQQTISTPEGSKSYELRGYHTEADSAGEFLTGNSHGVIELTDGHIIIRGVCQTAEHLDLLQPILPSIQLSLLENVRQN